MRRIFALFGILLLCMGRSSRCKVSAEAAAKACEAVRRGRMSRNAAAAAYGVSKTSLSRRLSGEWAMDARVGPGTVMTAAEQMRLSGL